MLIQDGKPIPGTERVREAIAFRPGDPNTRKQRGGWAGIALHWTGGENAWTVTREVLRSRKLSVQFVVDRTEIVQLADLSTRCAHIGSPGNDRFVGVEVRCRGYATKEDLAAAKAADPTLRDRDELDWSEPRDTYTDTIGGKRVSMASFDPKQVENLLWLCETVAGLYGFPRLIPYRQVPAITEDLRREMPVDPEAFVVRHEGRLLLPSFARDPRKGPSGIAATWRGAIGHLHTHEVKHDPGSQVFYALWAEGWNPSGKKLPGAFSLTG
jgi:hypothetical protein